MNVLFTTPLEEGLPAFQSLSFSYAVEQTHAIDQRLKKQNKESVALDFMVHDDEGRKLYAGTYHVGDPYASNLYEHICYRLIERRMRTPEETQERDRFLHQLTQEAPAPLRIDVNEQLQRQEEANQTFWSRLSPKARMMSGAAVGAVSLLFVFAIGMVAVVSSQTDAIDQVNAAYEQEKQTNDIYAQALAGEPETAIETLEGKNDRSDEENVVLTHLLIEQEAYEEAANLPDQSAESVADAIYDRQGIDALADFQDMQETAVGSFELAYDNEAFEEVIAMEEVPMNADRKEKLVNAYMHTDQLDEAKQIASELNNESLNEQIRQYEALTTEMEELQEQIEEESDDDDADEDQIEEWEEALVDVEAQLQAVQEGDEAS